MTKKRCHKKSKKGGGRNSGSARMGTVSWQRWRWGSHKRGGKKGVAKKRWQKRGDKKEVPEKTQMLFATVGHSVSGPSGKTS